MTAEELIIEHFEGTLTLEQEGELTQILATSPEARAMYDRYLRVDDVLAGDVAATAPSSALDERVLAAALGAIGGTIGGGAAWLGGVSGKVAAVVSVMAVGGLSFLLLSLDSDTPQPIAPVTPPAGSAPAVRPAPSIDPAVMAPAARAATESVTATEREPSVTTATPRPTVSTVDARNSRRPATTAPSTNASKPPLTLDGEPPTRIEHDPKIDDRKGK